MAWALWITGLPATGKSWLARELQRHLKFEWLRLDLFRKEIVPKPTYSEEERKYVYERLAERAAALVKEGKNVVIDATDNLGTGRSKARELIKDFGVVQLKCTPQMAAWLEENKRKKPLPGMERLYERAKKGEIQLPGVNAPYREEQNPLIVIESTKNNSVEEWAKQVLEAMPW